MCLSLVLVRKPLAMPVVAAVVPPLSSFRDGSSCPATEARGAAAPSGRGGNYGQEEPVAREPGLRMPRGMGAETAREGAVRRDEGGPAIRP